MGTGPEGQMLLIAGTMDIDYVRTGELRLDILRKRLSVLEEEMERNRRFA